MLSELTSVLDISVSIIYYLLHVMSRSSHDFPMSPQMYGLIFFKTHLAQKLILDCKSKTTLAGLHTDQ